MFSQKVVSVVTLNNNDTLIENLVDIKNKLESLISYTSNDRELEKIYNNLLSYIKTNCNHKTVDDYIDIDCDRSLKISYCEKCFETDCSGKPSQMIPASPSSFFLTTPPSASLFSQSVVFVPPLGSTNPTKPLR